MYSVLYCDVVAGNTKSLQWSGQYSRILLKRYHWHSRGSPGGIIWSGSSVAIGRQDGSLRTSIVLSLPSQSFFTFTWAGNRWEKWKCCIFLMPFNAVFVVYSLKCSLQLYVGTIVSPLWDPTNCAISGVADLLTVSTISSRQPVLVRLYHCLNSPKHQSGENLVCPTGRNDTFISLCNPTRTLRIK